MRETRDTKVLVNKHSGACHKSFATKGAGISGSGDGCFANQEYSVVVAELRAG